MLSTPLRYLVVAIVIAPRDKKRGRKYTFAFHLRRFLEKKTFLTVIIRKTVTMNNEFADIKLVKNTFLIPYISYIFFFIFFSCK